MKVLYIDIETAPNVAHVWSLWKQNVSLSQLRESSRVICFAAKWRGDKRMMYFSEADGGHEAMVLAAHALLSQADVIVHYNGRSFDIPTLNKEFVLAGLNPPAPFSQIDLLTVVRKRFRFPSNKLAYVSEALGIGGKVSHEGHELWVKWLAGDASALRRMAKYNKQDVALLELLHDRIMGWVTGAPIASLHDDSPEGCPNCGGLDLRREGNAYTQLGKFQRFQCRDCGAWSRSGRRQGGADLRPIS